MMNENNFKEWMLAKSECRKYQMMKITNQYIDEREYSFTVERGLYVETWSYNVDILKKAKSEIEIKGVELIRYAKIELANKNEKWLM